VGTLDGKDTALDYNALAANFGSGATKVWSQGDFNYDGVVNTLDFTALAQNFNQALPSPLGTLVPEPAGIALLLLLTCTAKRTHRRSLDRARLHRRIACA
jgi:hypothetical protein